MSEIIDKSAENNGGKYEFNKLLVSHGDASHTADVATNKNDKGFPVKLPAYIDLYDDCNFFDAMRVFIQESSLDNAGKEAAISFLELSRRDGMRNAFNIDYGNVKADMTRVVLRDEYKRGICIDIFDYALLTKLEDVNREIKAFITYAKAFKVGGIKDYIDESLMDYIETASYVCEQFFDLQDCFIQVDWDDLPAQSMKPIEFLHKLANLKREINSYLDYTKSIEAAGHEDMIDPSIKNTLKITVSAIERKIDSYINMSWEDSPTTTAPNIESVVIPTSISEPPLSEDVEFSDVPPGSIPVSVLEPPESEDVKFSDAPPESVRVIFSEQPPDSVPAKITEEPPESDLIILSDIPPDPDSKPGVPVADELLGEAPRIPPPLPIVPPPLPIVDKAPDALRSVQIKEQLEKPVRIITEVDKKIRALIDRAEKQSHEVSEWRIKCPKEKSYVKVELFRRRVTRWLKQAPITASIKLNNDKRIYQKMSGESAIRQFNRELAKIRRELMEKGISPKNIEHHLIVRNYRKAIEAASQLQELWVNANKRSKHVYMESEEIATSGCSPHPEF